MYKEAFGLRADIGIDSVELSLIVRWRDLAEAFELTLLASSVVLADRLRGVAASNLGGETDRGATSSKSAVVCNSGEVDSAVSEYRGIDFCEDLLFDRDKDDLEIILLDRVIDVRFDSSIDPVSSPRPFSCRSTLFCDLILRLSPAFSSPVSARRGDLFF